VRRGIARGGARSPRTRKRPRWPNSALAGGRADLLAEVAGIFEGTSEGEPDEPLARSAARLCRMAGADADAIPAWIEEGRRRSANARHPPFSAGLP
jgi:hypothetical protein